MFITLQDLHIRARKEKWAVPHFNFSSFELLHGIVQGVLESKAPVLLGTSENERKFVGLKEAVAVVRSLRDGGAVVFLNADHCHSVESAKEAFDAGYDSIHIDLSKKSFEENMKGTKQVVEYVKSKRPEVQVEGELGYLVTDSSKIYKEKILISEDSYTKTEEAVKFVQETGVDRLAPAIGTIHGIAVNTPHLKFDLVEELRRELPESVALVLHGGSGVGDEEMKRVIEMGFNNVHISTELRVAYTSALRKELKENPEETTPYHYLKESRNAVKELVQEKLKIFGTLNRV